jgi:hypothetical protein
MRMFCFSLTKEEKKKNRQKNTRDKIKAFEADFGINRECHNIPFVCQMLLAAIKYRHSNGSALPVVAFTKEFVNEICDVDTMAIKLGRASSLIVLTYRFVHGENCVNPVFLGKYKWSDLEKMSLLFYEWIKLYNPKVSLPDDGISFAFQKRAVGRNGNGTHNIFPSEEEIRIWNEAAHPWNAVRNGTATEAQKVRVEKMLAGLAEGRKTQADIRARVAQGTGSAEDIAWVKRNEEALVEGRKIQADIRARVAQGTGSAEDIAWVKRWVKRNEEVLAEGRKIQADMFSRIAAKDGTATIEDEEWVEKKIESLRAGYDAYLEIVSLVEAGGGTKEQKEKVAQIIERRNERSRRIQKARTDTLNNFAKLLVENETVVWHNGNLVHFPNDDEKPTSVNQSLMKNLFEGTSELSQSNVNFSHNDYTPLLKMVFENLGYSDAVKDCNGYEEMRNNVRQITEPQQVNTRKWSQAEERLFEEAVKAQGILPGKRIKNGAWDAVARHVKTRNKSQCRQKYQNARINDSETHSSGTWSNAEDALLRKAVAKHPSNWIEVAKSVGTRNNLSCRSRWSKIKDKTEDEIKKRFCSNDDSLLIQAVKEQGRNWAEVAKVVPGFDARQCRMRFNHLEEKKRKKESSKSSHTNYSLV